MAKAEGDTMQSFQRHIEDMRSLTLCKICLNPFFEPYIISCGHTYCYGCLRSWFGSTLDRGEKRSCPDCRVTVKSQPAPNYILRDLTHMFVDRVELLPEDESTLEYAKQKVEASGQLTADRDGLGLFQGVFKHAVPGHMPRPIRDLEDGVDRCPYCNWELEEGMCLRCGIDMRDSGVDSDGSEGSVEDGYPIPHPQAFYGVHSDSDDDSEDDSNISGPDDYDRHDDFLDNENEVDADEVDEELAMAEDYAHRRSGPTSFGYNAAAFRPYHFVGSDEEEGEDHLRPAWTNRRFRGVPTSPRVVTDDSVTNYDESEEEGENEHEMDPMHHDLQNLQSDDEDEDPIERSTATSAPINRRRPVVISDDEEDEEDEQDDEDVQPRRILSNSRHRIDSSASEDDSEEDEDEDGTMSNQSSDSSESDTDDDAVDHMSHEVDDSENSDDTIQPPQSHDDRRQKLNSQRARRPPQQQARVSSIDLTTPPRGEHAYGRHGNGLAQRGQRGRATRVY